jgi:hypothetical protein
MASFADFPENETAGSFKDSRRDENDDLANEGRKEKPKSEANRSTFDPDRLAESSFSNNEDYNVSKDQINKPGKRPTLTHKHTVFFVLLDLGNSNF